MAIVSKSGTFFEKGIPTIYTLSKAELAADAVVAADPYFSLESNWKSISVILRSTEGGQTKTLLFDASSTTPTALFKTTTSARDAFEVDRLTIFDYDDGQLILKRAVLNTADFDIQVYVPSTPILNLTFDSALDSGTPSGLVMTQSPVGLVAATAGVADFDTGISGGWFHCETPAPLPLGQTGSIQFDIDFKSNSVSTQYLFGLRKSKTEHSNVLYLTHHNFGSGGSLRPYMESSTGGEVILDGTVDFDPVLGVFYTILLEWDLDSFGAKLYVDGTLLVTVPATGTGRTDEVSNLGIGTPPHEWEGPYGAARIDNVIIYAEPTLG